MLNDGAGRRQLPQFDGEGRMNGFLEDLVLLAFGGYLLVVLVGVPALIVAFVGRLLGAW